MNKDELIARLVAEHFQLRDAIAQLSANIQAEHARIEAYTTCFDEIRLALGLEKGEKTPEQLADAVENRIEEVRNGAR